MPLPMAPRPHRATRIFFIGILLPDRPFEPPGGDSAGRNSGAVRPGILVDPDAVRPPREALITGRRTPFDRLPVRPRET